VGNKDVLKRWLRSGASSLLVLGLLTGCTGTEPEPTFTPTLPDSTPSPDDDPEPDADVDPVDELEPPEIPDELSENTVEGAETAARFYIEAFNYGYAMLDTEPLEFISLPECQTCAKHIDAIPDLKEKNQVVSGGMLEAGPVIETWEAEDNIVIAFTVTQEPLTITDANGSEVRSHPQETVTAEVLTRFDGEKWQIAAHANQVEEK